MPIVRVKTWVDGEVLFSDDLDAEFDNVINAEFNAANVGPLAYVSTSGSTSRTLADRADDVFNVKDWILVFGKVRTIPVDT